MNFLSKYIRAIGVIIIIFFSFVCVFWVTVGRGLTQNDQGREFYNTVSGFESKFYDLRVEPLWAFNTDCPVDTFSELYFLSEGRNSEIIQTDTDHCRKGQLEDIISKLDKIKTDAFYLFEMSLYIDQIQDVGEIFDEEKKAEALKKIKPIEEIEKDFHAIHEKKIAKFKASIQNKIDTFHIEFVGTINEAKNNPNKRFKSKSIVLIKIDEKSLEIINSWPIPRDNYVTLLEKLKAFNAKTVAFDVLFPEESKTCDETSIDSVFADSIKNFQKSGDKRVVLAYTVEEKALNNVSGFSELPPELYGNMIASQNSSGITSSKVSTVLKSTWVIDKLLEAEPDLGYLNNNEDSDGVFRYYQLLAYIDEIYFPSIGYRAYTSFTGKSETVEVDSIGESFIKFADNEISLNKNLETKIRWIGNKTNFDSISLHKVLSADQNDPKLKELFNNKIVFIASTAVGAHDFRNTPIDTKLPGVYAHMNLTEMLLQGYFYKPDMESMHITLGFLVLTMAILMGVMLLNKAILDISVLTCLIIALYAIDFYLFLPEGYFLKLVSVYFSLIASYSYITIINFNQSNAEKKQIKGAFSRYVAPSIVDDMLDNPEKLKVGGERIDITCLFSDVRDFTSISEMLTPAELAATLNRYMGEMTDIVFEYNGTLDKYIGDAIVAFWGAPLDIGDHVDQAMDAAVKMLEVLPNINREFKEKGMPEFKIGLGLNSGICSVGNMGSDQIFAYTALGDSMNLGARLESLCKHYGAQILVSEYTYEKMNKDKFTTRLIDKVRVKGKNEPVGVYEVLYSYHPFMVNKHALKSFKEGYQFYLDAKFIEALNIFDGILEFNPDDKASLRLKESCEHWIESPPEADEDWTITTMTSK